MSDQSQTMCSPCPTRAELEAFLSDELALAERMTIGQHLTLCDNCGTMVRELGSDHPAAQFTARSFNTNQLLLNSSSALDNPVSNAVLESNENSNPTASHPRRYSSAPELSLPYQLGQYRLQELIGSGGMGTVYRAEHLHLKKLVAVKLLRPERIADAAARARFRREMEVVGRLDHPNIVRATDAGEVDSIHYLVMEFIDGMNLTQVVRRCGPLPVAEACELIRQAAIGLLHAHESGLVHRDIKPQNVMLTKKGEVKLLDLGLALLQKERFSLSGLTGSGQVMGTADYMAPEQWEDCHWVDIRADIYSLGCTLYFLLAGHPPFGGPGNASIVRKMAAHLRDTPPALRPDLEAASEVLLRLLAKDPAQRPQTPDEVIQQLTPLAAGADLHRLFDRAAKCTEVDDNATWSQVQAQEVRPPSTQVTGLGTVSLNIPRRSRLSRKTVIVGLVALAGAIALIAGIASRPFRDRPPSQDMAATPTNPSNEQSPTIQPVFNAWEKLLLREPKPRLWPPAGNSRWQYDPKMETLWVHAYQPTLIRLGETSTQNYKLEIGIRQTNWEGGVGVYIGGHIDKNDGKFRFQIIHLDKTPGGLVLARSRGTIEQIPQPVGGTGASVIGFAAEPLKRDNDYLELLLELNLKSLGRMGIRWNGDEYQNLTDRRFDERVQDADYHGEFGIYSNNAAATITTARIFQSQ